jgi:hypothetical protein
MKLQFADQNSQYEVSFSFSQNETHVNMTRCYFTPDECGKYAACGWGGEYKNCPYFSDEARKFFDKALTMKAFW